MDYYRDVYLNGPADEAEVYARLSLLVPTRADGREVYVLGERAVCRVSRNEYGGSLGSFRWRLEIEILDDAADPTIWDQIAAVLAGAGGWTCLM